MIAAIVHMGGATGLDERVAGPVDAIDGAVVAIVGALPRAVRQSGYRGPRLGGLRADRQPRRGRHLVLVWLAGAMGPRTLHFRNPTADKFRTALLRQVTLMLGRAG